MGDNRELEKQCKNRCNQLLKEYKKHGYNEISFYRAIKRILFENNLSLTTVSKKLNVSYSSFNNWVNNRSLPLSVENIFKLEVLLNLPAGYLITLVIKNIMEEKETKRGIANGKNS